MDEQQQALQQQIEDLRLQIQNRPAQQPAEIARVAIKVVPFLKDEPDLYFIQLEAQFSNALITNDQTKYNHAIANFDPKFLQKVTDLLRNPPAANKYAAFKARILKEFSDSQERKLHRLIQDSVLGDDKPSQLLERMKDLAGNAINDDAIKSLWIQRLPERSCRHIHCTRRLRPMGSTRRQNDGSVKLPDRSGSEQPMERRNSVIAQRNRRAQRIS